MLWRIPTGRLEAIPGEPEAVILLLDISGSMADDDYPPSRLEAMKEAAVKFIERKHTDSPDDQVGIITFGSSAEICCSLVPVRTGYHKLLNAVKAIEIKGTTEMVAGLKEAGRAIAPGWFRKVSVSRRIILLSDGGHSGIGNPVKVAASLKAEGIIVECVGIGDRELLDEDTLRKIASIHNKRGVLYRWIGDRENLERHFIEMSNKLVIKEGG
ncbi:MAG: hypothetical protein A2X34_07830 [Elusimicrobia bacterium GWC2_51_8]|nr:MAG: hypothetical protein A2X33_10030 [Elusimicrobia bacterium GWA2_51_34]OGR61896.1 MAG: hypothetical protein A2X34_07830 [Elusimicrobia bacterium GWC2_51_8]OGR84701.1 MAG: hypothetical protein A2021_03745 [Elusimicrobia bacterium GWF2_52_66]